MKMKKSKKLPIILLSGAVLVAVSVVIFLFFNYYWKISYSLKNPVFEINSSATVEDLVENISKGMLVNGADILETETLGDHEQKIIIRNKLEKDTEIYAHFAIDDTIPPNIEGEDALTIYENGEIDILSQYDFSDNSLLEIKTEVSGEYNTKKVGEYRLTLIATDLSNNVSEKSITLNVIKDPSKQVNSNPYYIKINRKLNTVMVYGLDDFGKYTKLVKTFVASTGKDGSSTPLGTFKVSDRHETLFLVGNVWGHYTLRITGAIFFHSVPYFTKGAPWNNLEYEEYNKLGEKASAGCVRLAAIDAKWIYDNIPYGTTVEIYDADVLPSGVIKPTSIKIDPNSDKRGWDPTDPDPSNPWKQ